MRKKINYAVIMTAAAIMSMSAIMAGCSQDDEIDEACEKTVGTLADKMMTRSAEDGITATFTDTYTFNATFAFKKSNRPDEEPKTVSADVAVTVEHDSACTQVINTSGSIIGNPDLDYVDSGASYTSPRHLSISIKASYIPDAEYKFATAHYTPGIQF